jgi:transposase-like protein
MLYVRFPLSLRNVEDLLHERGVEISPETVRLWWHRFGPMFAAEIRKRRIDGMKSSHWRWHLDEIFVKIKGVKHHLWRAIDYDGEVLESFVTKTRDKKAALKFLRKAMKKHGRSEVLVTDKLRSYGAALKDLGASDRQETRRWLNNRAENSHLPFRRGDAALPAHAKSADVRLRPRLRHEPLQHRAQPLQPTPLQGQPCRCSRRAARPLPRLKQAECHVDSPDEDFGRVRLRQPTKGFRIFRTFDTIRIIISRGEQAPDAKFPADLDCGVNAVAIRRYPDVHEDERRLLLPGQCQRLGEGCRNTHDRVTCGDQHVFKRKGD